jgi:hypothetical protein
VSRSEVVALARRLRRAASRPEECVYRRVRWTLRQIERVLGEESRLGNAAADLRWDLPDPGWDGFPLEELRVELRALAHDVERSEREPPARRARCGECGIALVLPLRAQPSGHVRVCRGCSLLDAAGYSTVTHALLEIREPGSAERVTQVPEIHALVLREPAAMRAWARRTGGR